VVEAGAAVYEFKTLEVVVVVVVVAEGGRGVNSGKACAEVVQMREKAAPNGRALATRL
jgi:acetyl-CoA carboxylase alpha subunit